MSTDLPRSRFRSLFVILPGIALGLSLVVFGCGSSEESTEDWETTPEVSPTAKLEYQVDSLKNENRRVREQLDAMSAENRSLTARSAELETKLNEATAKAASTTTAPAATSTDVSGATYDGALAEFRRRNFTGAIDQLQSLLKGGISEDMVGHCHYWIGESYYGLRKYKDAINSFEMVFDSKPTHKKADAQLMIGNSYLALGDKKAARDAFEKMISNYPASPNLKKAQEKLDRLK